MQGKRIGKKKKTSVKSNNLNPYWNESFVFLIDEYDMKKVFLDVTVSGNTYLNKGGYEGRSYINNNSGNILKKTVSFVFLTHEKQFFLTTQ